MLVYDTFDSKRELNKLNYRLGKKINIIAKYNFPFNLTPKELPFFTDGIL